MFLIDIPFKGCQGHSNCSSIMHAVSYYASGVSDKKKLKMHAVSMTLHVSCIDTTCIFNFLAYHCCFAYDFHFFEVA
jgi:hypothetical protein